MRKLTALTAAAGAAVIVLASFAPAEASVPHHICDIDCLGGLYLNYPGHGFQVSMQESGAAYTPVNSSTWGSRTTYQWEAGFPVLSGNCLTWNSADGKVYLRNCKEYPLAQAFYYDGASLINEQDSQINGSDYGLAAASGAVGAKVFAAPAKPLLDSGLNYWGTPDCCAAPRKGQVRP